MTSTADSRNILVVISAGDCSACKYYKENKVFDKIKEGVTSSGYVRYEHIEVSSMKDSIDKKYPQVLNKWKRFFPIFILINGKDWNNELKDIDEKNPNIEIFNARIVEGTIVPINDISNGPDKIPDWIKTQVTSNAKFKGTIIQSSKLPQLAEKDKSVEADITAKYLPTCGAVKIMVSNRR